MNNGQHALPHDSLMFNVGYIWTNDSLMNNGQHALPHDSVMF